MKITEINIYPVKSLKGSALQESLVEKRGLAFDRRWMLVDKDNKFLTQRELPKMAILKSELKENNLRISDLENEILIPLYPQTNEKVKVQIWSSNCSANVYANEINDWFSEVLRKICKLVFMPDDSKRIVNPLYAANKFEDVVSFADGYPLLMIGESSLKDLNSRLEQKVSMNRFRPNLVFEDSEPFAEDNWKKIKIGNTIFQVVKPCDRC
ncbi:MAG: MOSC domain-containing protein, partial [Pyrinomonadaceae bacterium]